MPATATKKAPARKKPAAKKPAAKRPSARRTKSDNPAQIARPSNQVTTLPLSELAPSPLNPRKTFSDTSIAEMADSLYSQGQLQNLGVRKVSDTTPCYHVIYGERRLRGMQKLVADGRWPADAPVEVRIEEIDDATHLERAILENERREEVHPLEQAEAYAKLAALREAETGDAGSVTALIAERTGETRRNVQIYLQCARKLTDAVKAAWTDGRIGTRKLALAVARLDPGVQKQVLAAIDHQRFRNEDELKEWVAKGSYPAEAAKFDLTTYRKRKGLETGGEDGEPHRLLSRDLFLELQAEVAKQEARELAEEYGLTEIVQASWWFRTDGDRVRSKKNVPPGAEARWSVDRNTGEIWRGVYTDEAPPTEDAPAEEEANKGPQPYARKNWMAGAMARTHMVRTLVRNDTHAALAIALVALLPREDHFSPLCGIRTDRHAGDPGEVTRSMPAEMPDNFAGLDGFKDGQITDARAATAALLKLPEADLLRIFAYFIADQCVDMSWTAAPGSRPETLAMIEHGPVASKCELEEMAPDVTGTDWLKAYTIDQLTAIAEATGAADAMREAGTPPTANKAYMVSTLKDHCPQDWTPPEARLKGEDAMIADVDTMLKGGKS